MTQTAWNWTMGAALAALLAIGTTMDPDPDLSGEASAAAKQARAEARHEQAAAQFCARAHGYGTRHGWDAQGRITCTKPFAVAGSPGELLPPPLQQ